VSDKYILDGHNAVPIDDLLEWGRWLQTAKRTVAKDELPSGTRVSTVFLGLDYNHGFGSPRIFETMIFGGPLDQEQDRYATWEEAETGHAAMLARAKEAEKS
jgi:hypothetical protein